jgi:hypothetical protein
MVLPMKSCEPLNATELGLSMFQMHGMLLSKFWSYLLKTELQVKFRVKLLEVRFSVFTNMLCFYVQNRDGIHKYIPL